MARPSPRPAQTPAIPPARSFRQLLKTPNLITLSRLFLIPVILALLSKHRFTEALYLFVLAAITDALDGAIARWSGMRTELGAFLDPFADKLLLLSSLVVLTAENAFPGWLLSVVVIRDIVIVFGYFTFSFLTKERMPVRPSFFGKACTVLQIACVIAALMRLDLYYPKNWAALLYVTVFFTALSGIHYAYRGLVWLGSEEPQIFS
ncbi:MAG: CDP-alcohol phosphatidyltransferase family protein [Candidatus Binataceae bacterium]